MPQYAFSSDTDLINQIDLIAQKENRSRSEMIGILLKNAIREKNRRKKIIPVSDHSANQR